MTDRKLAPIHYTTLVRIFERDGFRVVRQKGDHLVLTKAGMPRERYVPLLDEVE